MESSVDGNDQVLITSKPMPIAVPMWAGSKVTKSDRSGKPLGGGEVDGVGEAHRLGPCEGRGPVEAALVDRHDVQVVPRVADRVLEIEPQDRLRR